MFKKHKLQLCVNCGHSNGPKATVCAKCRTSLVAGGSPPAPKGPDFGPYWEQGPDGSPQPKQQADPHGYVLHSLRRMDYGHHYLYHGRAQGPNKQAVVVGANREENVLIVGPTRSGKTSSVIVPMIFGTAGPLLSTSTKDEVMKLTHTARSRYGFGRCWLFDPSGTVSPPEGVSVIHWSPVDACTSPDGATFTAHAMIAASQTGGKQDDYWLERASALLAPLLYAAYLAGRPIGDVLQWVNQHRFDAALETLEQHNEEFLAHTLEGLDRAAPQEQAGIWGTAASVLFAYRAEGARAAAAPVEGEPRFFVDEFVKSRDTIYICAAGRFQKFLAPIIVAFVSEISHAVFTESARNPNTYENWPMVFVLDEAANIAPISDLPSILAECAGQNLQVVVCLQDLAQAQKVWPVGWMGIVNNCGSKLVLGGSQSDVTTLDYFSKLSGEYEVTRVTGSVSQGPGGPTRSEAEAVERRARLSPGEIRETPIGHGYLFSPRVTSVCPFFLTPYYSEQPWKAIADHLYPTPPPLHPWSTSSAAVNSVFGRVDFNDPACPYPQPPAEHTHVPTTA